MQLLTNLPPLQHGDLGLTFIGHSSIFGHRKKILYVATPRMLYIPTFTFNVRPICNPELLLASYSPFRYDLIPLSFDLYLHPFICS